jgi:tRNA(Ile)-lysidine synthase
MDAVVEAIAARVREGGLLAEDQRVVVLLSGGRDSVCLLDLAVVVAGAEHVRALHVHHGLRGEEADADAAHCERLAGLLGVELEVVRLAPPASPGGNVQAWAREARYAAGARAAQAYGARLAAGHTLTDQAETILYRLAASPGRRALLGMDDERGLLVRPLLRARITREETEHWCRERGLEWREDSSNEDDRYARGRVRAALVPALEGVHPAAVDNVARTAELLRDEAAVLDEVVRSALAGSDRIALDELAKRPPALARLIVRRLAEDATGALCARAASRLDDVLALGDSGALDVGDGARAVVEGGVLRFERTPPLPGV